MTGKGTQSLIFAAIVIIGYAAVFALAGRLESARPALPEGYADRDLELQGARLKGFALGNEGLLADWYWMQSLQYIGRKIIDNPEAKVSIDNLKPLNPRLLYPYLENSTSLDPKFKAPYLYGAIVLPAIDPEQAIAIAEKGIRENPSEFRLFQHLGFIHWRLGNYEKASEVYARGAAIPGAPPFLQLMAAQMKSQGGSRETARAIYRQMADESEGQSRDLALLRLAELDFFDERDALRPALNAFRERNGRCAARWSELFPLLKTVKLPGGREFRIDRNDNLVDPTGVPYLLDTEGCDVRIDVDRSKIPTS
jgi:tetratricopeptide (TPR) repeat protein